MIVRTLAIHLLIGVVLGIALLFLIVRSLGRPLGLSDDLTSSLAYQPVAIFDRTTCDLGTIESGRVCEATFQIQNTGNRRLILRKTNASCDCLSVTDADILVEPGTSQTLAAQFDTSKSLGPLTLELYYRSNDPQQPHLKFIVMANVLEKSRITGRRSLITVPE